MKRHQGSRGGRGGEGRTLTKSAIMTTVRKVGLSPKYNVSPTVAYTYRIGPHAVTINKPPINRSLLSGPVNPAR